MATGKGRTRESELSFTVTTVIHCEFCGVYTKGVISTSSKKKLALEEAKKADWKRLLRGDEFIDLCPACVKVAEDGNVILFPVKHV